MIFVTVGTQPQHFNRLFDELTRLVNKNEIDEKIIAQTGNNEVKSDIIECFDYKDLAQMKQIIQDARLIISHGGTGSIITALKMGKKVIGVPRLAKYGEHVNDHQKDLIDVLSENNLIIPVYDIKNLKKAILQSENFVPNQFISGTHIIMNDICEYLSECFHSK